MKKGVIKFLAIAVLLICNVALIMDSNIVIAAATTEVNIENNEEKSFLEKLKEKLRERKEAKEIKKEIRKFNRKIKKAEKFLNKKKYGEVLELLKPEFNKDIDISKAKLLYDMVKYYMEATEDFENKRYELAKEKLNQIDSSYEDYKIEEDIKKLKTNIEEKLDYKEKINIKIDEINILMNKKMLDSAKFKISELLDMDINEEQKEKLAEIKSNLDLMIEKEKKLEEEKKRAEEEKKRAEEEKKRAEEEKKRVESEKRKQEELKKQQDNVNKKSSNNSANSNTKTYYIAAGNRYYHRSSSCKFLEGAATTVTSNISNKFACNCIKYN